MFTSTQNFMFACRPIWSIVVLKLSITKLCQPVLSGFPLETQKYQPWKALLCKVFNFTAPYVTNPLSY